MSRHEIVLFISGHDDAGTYDDDSRYSRGHRARHRCAPRRATGNAGAARARVPRRRLPRRVPRQLGRRAARVHLRRARRAPRGRATHRVHVPVRRRALRRQRARRIPALAHLPARGRRSLSARALWPRRAHHLRRRVSVGGRRVHRCALCPGGVSGPSAGAGNRSRGAAGRVRVGDPTGPPALRVAAGGRADQRGAAPRGRDAEASRARGRRLRRCVGRAAPHS